MNALYCYWLFRGLSLFAVLYEHGIKQVPNRIPSNHRITPMRSGSLHLGTSAAPPPIPALRHGGGVSYLPLFPSPQLNFAQVVARRPPSAIFPKPGRPPPASLVPLCDSAGQKKWRRHTDSNRGIKALQASALPLGYAAPLPTHFKDIVF